MNCTEAVAYKD